MNFSITQLQKACIAYKEFGEVQYVGSGIMNSDSMISTMGAFYGEILAVVLVGVINMFCIIMLDWEIQKKEYAILRSVGATKINVLKVIVAEKGYIGLLSFLIGCVGGTILEKLLLRISIEGKVPFTLQWLGRGDFSHNAYKNIVKQKTFGVFLFYCFISRVRRGWTSCVGSVRI